MLTLVPRDARLATQVRELQIAGLASDVRSVALWLGGGDRSVMAVDALQAAATAPRDEPPDDDAEHGQRPPPPPPRRRWGVVLLWTLLLAAALVQILRTPFSTDLSAFLPANPDAQQRLLIEQLQGRRARPHPAAGDRRRAGPGTRRRLACAGQGAMRTSGLFEQVQNGETSAYGEIGSWLFDNRYQLSPAVTAQRFTHRRPARSASTKPCRCWARRPVAPSSRCWSATPRARPCASPKG
jgi:hypothetical protein